MNKISKLGLGILVSAGLLTSCATKDYVQQQLKPIKEKITALEKRLSKVEDELTSLKQDVKANKDKIIKLEKEHKAIKEQLNKIASESNKALKKSDKNADYIKALEAELKRTNENLQKAIEKGLRK